MQKLLPILALLFVLTVTPATAVSNNSSSENCDPAAEWKNHGEYVSCVAHTHPGGDVVSAAAQSDVGKKNAEASPSTSPSVLPSPSASPEVSPSPAVSPLPDVSPSPEVSPLTEASPTPSVSPSPSPGEEENENQFAGISHAVDSLQKLIEKLQGLINRLENLL